MQNESSSLYLCDANSDKEYHVDLAQSGDGWTVSFRFGRRGSSLTCGTKTKDPVPYENAKKLYDRLIREKQGKGYTTGLSGTIYQDTPKEVQFTGILPQLLNCVDESELEILFRDPAWCMEVKHDGERRMASNVDELFGINRKGMRVALPMPIVEGLSGAPRGTVIDSEIVGDALYVFDLMSYEGRNVRSLSYRERYSLLESLVASLASHPSIRMVTAAVTEAEKRALFKAVKDANGEGVVCKRWDAQYVPGRPNSGGDQLKFKFVETATLVVEAQNDTKRSVQVAAFDQAGDKVLLGNVTIPPNYPVPEVSAIVEVEYLYAFQNGCLFQPVFRGERTDQTLEDCLVSQLKYKPLSVAA